LNKKSKQTEEILDKSCFICGRPNRFHRVFWSPYQNCYIRQVIDDEWLDEPLVPSSDHYAMVDNLEYLEYMEKKEKRNGC